MFIRIQGVGELKFIALLHKEVRSGTYSSLFPALQPGQVIELREELLLLDCEHTQKKRMTLQHTY